MKLPEVITRNVGRQILTLRKQSPNIAFVGGIVGILGATFLACKATLKLEDTLEEISSDIKGAKSLNEKETYPAEEYRKDVMYAYGKASMQIVKLYGPAVVLGSASIGLLTSSHVQLTRRNSALMAAYATLQKAYDDYRDRVRAELGEEKELDLYHAATREVVKGEEDKVTADPNQWSPYARFFDEASSHWVKNPELNRIYIQCQQNYANDLLRSRGHVFLNEVYDMLDFERTKAGQVVGWVIGKDGDNYVDFGIYRAFNSLFVNGRERTILLDFNVDGVIYDKI
jgi:hypothetical protein